MVKKSDAFPSSLDAMGYQTIWTAAETTAPKKSVTIEKNLLLNPAWIDSESVDDPDSSAYLYTE